MYCLVLVCALRTQSVLFYLVAPLKKIIYILAYQVQYIPSRKTTTTMFLLPQDSGSGNGSGNMSDIPPSFVREPCNSYLINPASSEGRLFISLVADLGHPAGRLVWTHSNVMKTRRSVEHSTPHTDDAPLHFTGFSYILKFYPFVTYVGRVWNSISLQSPVTYQVEKDQCKRGLESVTPDLPLFLLTFSR